MEREQQDNRVTDAEIERIVAENEAGIADVVAVYEPIEQAYFAAVQPASGVDTYAASTVGL
jgi:hypothetical protein